LCTWDMFAFISHLKFEIWMFDKYKILEEFEGFTLSLSLHINLINP